jgi:hypothetical protein
VELRWWFGPVHVLLGWSIGRLASFCAVGGLRLLVAICGFAMAWCCTLMLGHFERELVLVYIVDEGWWRFWSHVKTYSKAFLLASVKALILMGCCVGTLKFSLRKFGSNFVRLFSLRVCPLSR